MHIGLFFLINLAVAGAICVLAYVNGHGAWGIALRGIGTLVVLQAAYAIWLFAVAWMAPPEARERSRGAQAADRTPRPTKMSAQPRDRA
jgi:hypothetical protein